MSLYLIIILATVAIPLSLSFDRRLQFYKKWKVVFPSIVFVALVYIIFDILFTKQGIWGFNPEYLSGIYIFQLPIEEILFFFAIPYASLFLHFSIVEYFPKFSLNKNITLFLSLFLMFFSLVLAITNFERSYTLYISLKVFLVLLFLLVTNKQIIRRFMATFMVILIPFIIVNGVLTGTGIENEVVWYNNAENLGIRFITIPVEDFGYAFSLILFNLFLMEKLRKTFHLNE